MVTPLDERVTWLVTRVHARSHAFLQQAFAAGGSRPYHYRVLLALAEHGPASQAEVGRVSGIDRSDVTAALDVLCDAGFAVRTPDGTDRRRNVVSLTREGRRELERLDAVLDDVQHQLLAMLTDDERRTLRELLTRVATADPGAA